jgi:hypothetical protein
VCLLNSQKTSIKIKQLKIEPHLFLAFFSVGPGNVDVFFAVLSLPPECLGDVRGRCAIFRTPPAPSGRPPDWSWGWSACFLPLADPPTVRTLSKMVKKPRQSLLRLPVTFWISPSSSPRKAVWLLSWPTSWERQIVVKSGVNYLSRHVMGLSEFHDTLSTIILHLGGNPGDGHHCSAISLIRRRRCPFSYFAFR